MGVTTALRPVEQSGRDKRVPEPCIFVVFGASGDLTRRKLLPALFHLRQAGLLSEEFAVVGVARRDLSETFIPDMKDGIVKGGGVAETDPRLDSFLDRVKYFQTDFDDDDGLERLKQYVAELDEELGTRGNRLFYLAVAPEYFADIIARLGAHGMAQSGEEADNWVVIEKPFGTDLASAKKLNDDVNAVFSEGQIFRIDHYLGKETVQNILFFRFGNGIFEPIWNRNYVERVEITIAETVGVEGRGPFYEKAGALRDILQNHAMEVLALIAMEPPESFQAEAVRSEKMKVWHSIAAIPLEHAIRGQYGPGKIDGKKVVGYRQEDRVQPESDTETFAEVRLEIANWRWAGVPFHLRTGKRLAKRFTEARIIFKASPTQLFKQDSGIGESEPNVITLRIQPDDGICLQFGVKPPGLTADLSKVAMRFKYEDAFGKSSANGYERLLLDAMLGDATLFSHRDGVEATWALFTPILDAWAKDPDTNFPNYSGGSWGPSSVATPLIDEALTRGRNKVD
jgi:glucose-6-phosphate 1-dehydrogenase